MNGTIDLNYDSLTWLCKKQDREGLLRALETEANNHDFEETEETRWAYLRVKSFLADGWTSFQRYVEMRLDENISEKELGRMINLLVRGTSPDRPEGKSPRPYVFDVPGGRAAAFLFFCATESPQAVAA